MPVIVEDDVLVGGNTGVYEGAVVKQRAVIAAGVVLTGIDADLRPAERPHHPAGPRISRWSCRKARSSCPARAR